MDNFKHGGNIFEIERKLGKSIIDFSASINPYGPPTVLKKVINKKFASLRHYPDKDYFDLKRVIADYFKISCENILIGNGSAELIHLVFRAFLPKRVNIVVPGFSEYERAAKIYKSKINFSYLSKKDNFKLNTQAVMPSDLFICGNPNNPTGNFLFDNRFNFNKANSRLFVVDEAFMDFSDQEKKYSFVKKACKNRGIIVLRTLTKFFSLPGLRIGYLAADKNIIKRLSQAQVPWACNSLADACSKIALKQNKFIVKSRLAIKQERTFLISQLSKISNLKFFPSAANYILFKINNPKINSSYLSKRLLNKNSILIRDCANFRGLNSRFIRVAVRARKDNLKLIKALKEVL